MTTKHTPGPWYNGKDAQGNPIVCQEYDTEMLFGGPNLEFQANCRLIDAAPDLLEVVQAVAGWNAKYPSHRIYSETSIRQIAAEMDAINEKARAAIAKAGGAA